MRISSLVLEKNRRVNQRYSFSIIDIYSYGRVYHSISNTNIITVMILMDEAALPDQLCITQNEFSEILKNVIYLVNFESTESDHLI